jgi:lipoprotein-releasing system ATP-binding protein
MIIKTSQITKSYGKLQVLKGIDLEIKKGEVITVVGASGAGKSTLLHILGTLDNPDGGDLHYEGTNPFSLNRKKLSKFRNEKIGFVFQFHHLLPEFTALENVCIPAWIGGKGKSESIRKAKELLEFLNLGDRIEHKPSQMSGGEQQRVAVARALINNPKVILADEPSGNLDSEQAAGLHKLFFDLRENFGQTFVIVTHNPELAALSDRTLRISDGRIVSGN